MKSLALWKSSRQVRLQFSRTCFFSVSNPCDAFHQIVAKETNNKVIFALIIEDEHAVSVFTQNKH